MNLYVRSVRHNEINKKKNIKKLIENGIKVERFQENSQCQKVYMEYLTV